MLRLLKSPRGRRLRSFILFGMALLLTGCGYLTSYHNPEVAVENRWSVRDRYIQKGDDQNLPYLAWWHGFQDPTLNQLIDRGLMCNTTLNMSRGNIEAAQGELKKVRYQWIPSLDFMMGYSKNPAFGFPGVLAVLIPSYTLNIFHQIRQQKQATYALAQVRAEDDAIKLAIIAQITASYFTYQAEVEHQKLLQILVKDITTLAIIARKVYKDGLSSDIDPEDLESRVNVVRGDLEVVLQNVIVSRNAIRYLIDENPGDIKTTLSFLELHNHELIPGSLPLTVLENRPDMRVAENQLRASNVGIGLAASNLLPTLNLDLIGGVSARRNRYDFPQHGVDFNDQLFTTPIVAMSVLGEIAKARGLDKVSYYHYIDTLQNALRDTTNALSANEHVTNKLKKTTHAQHHLAKAYELNRRLYEQGIQTYVDTLKSKIVLDRINIDLNQDKLQQLLTVVMLYKELAGGYRVNS